MPLHDCPHTFAELAASVLPAHMARMRKQLLKLRSMAHFAQKGCGVRTLLDQMQLADDFSGCYVMVDKEVPVYVGISRSVIARLRQHVTGRGHSDASLAFRIAIERHPDAALRQLTRDQAMADETFSNGAFAEAKRYLQSLQVAIIEIDNPLELYVFEPYCALELDTKQWNSFATH